MGGIRLHKPDGSVSFYTCERWSCDYEQIDDVYSWKQAIREKKWTVEKAILINGEKASGKNMDLWGRVRENEHAEFRDQLLELYCPNCSSK